MTKVNTMLEAVWLEGMVTRPVASAMLFTACTTVERVIVFLMLMTMMKGASHWMAWTPIPRFEASAEVACFGMGDSGTGISLGGLDQIA